MIKANELRIGNWVEEFNPHHPDYRNYLQVESIDKDGINLVAFTEYEIGAIESNPNINPIPLTPEILEQCGFLKDNGNRFIKYTGEAREFLKIYLGDKLEDMWGKYQQIDMYIMFDHIKSLHQLQNLYFALTGEELQVNIHENIKNEI